MGVGVGVGVGVAGTARSTPALRQAQRLHTHSLTHCVAVTHAGQSVHHLALTHSLTHSHSISSFIITHSHSLTHAHSLTHFLRSLTLFLTVSQFTLCRLSAAFSLHWSLPFVPTRFPHSSLPFHCLLSAFCLLPSLFVVCVWLFVCWLVLLGVVVCRLRPPPCNPPLPGEARR